MAMTLCTCKQYTMWVGGAHNGRGWNSCMLLLDDEEERSSGVVSNV